MPETDDTELEALFAELRAAPEPAISELAMARMLRAAEAAQPAPQLGFWAGIGGWAGASGLVAASLAGLWIGFSPPAGLSSYFDALSGETVSVTLPGEGDFMSIWEEG